MVRWPAREDSFLRRLDSAKILSVAAFQEKSGNKKNGKKKKSQTPPNGSGVNGGVNKFSPTKYAVAMSDSILFPEGGGQPPDQGNVQIKSSSGEDRAHITRLQRAERWQRLRFNL